MNISGFQKLTLLDYPQKVACIIFTQGCNFKCPFCHNADLIDVNKKGTISEDEIFDYLEKRKGVIEGVSITGGEPLLQKDISRFISKVKSLGYKVKIDTNGSDSEKLKKLIEAGLIDYVAMDIKSTFDKYDITSGKRVSIENIKKSIKIIEESKIDYEFRTTLVKGYHNIEDIKEICKMFNKKSKYYLQNFIKSDGVLNKNLSGLSIEELEKIRKELKIIYPNILFRDI